MLKRLSRWCLALYICWLRIHIVNIRYCLAYWYMHTFYLLYCTILSCSFVITVILRRTQELWESLQREDTTALPELILGKIGLGERGRLWTPPPPPPSFKVYTFLGMKHFHSAGVADAASFLSDCVSDHCVCQRVFNFLSSANAFSYTPNPCLTP
jgi:hypothetical protein